VVELFPARLLAAFWPLLRRTAIDVLRLPPRPILSTPAPGAEVFQ
jgi:hypothetical protein